MQPDVLKYLHDARDSARAILGFIEGRSPGEYCSDRRLRSAVEREFITIGEALRQAVSLDPTVRSAVSHVREIVGFRNLLVHGYSGVDDRAVWETAAHAIPTSSRRGVCWTPRECIATSLRAGHPSRTGARAGGSRPMLEAAATHPRGCRVGRLNRRFQDRPPQGVSTSPCHRRKAIPPSVTRAAMTTSPESTTEGPMSPARP